MRHLDTGEWFAAAGFASVLTGLCFLLLGHGPLIWIYELGVPWCSYALNADCPPNPLTGPLQWVSGILVLIGLLYVIRYGKESSPGRFVSLAAVGLLLTLVLFFVMLGVTVLYAFAFNP